MHHHVLRGTAVGARVPRDHRVAGEPVGPPDVFLVRALEELTPRDAEIAGDEAVELGCLTRAGLPVLPGFVVTTSAYARSMEVDGVRRALSELYGLALGSADRTVPAELGIELAGLIRGTGLCDEVATAVRSAYSGLGIENLGPVRAVVRPSPVQESPDFGGHGPEGGSPIVRGALAVIEGIIDCWASVFGPEVLIQRAALDRVQPAMAVVVQAVAGPASAGLAFTSEPATIEQAVLIRPCTDSWPPDGLGQTTTRLTDAETERVAQLVLRAQRWTGRAQAIEWVLADDRLHVVRARPLHA